MARFNSKKAEQTTVTNLAGGQAYSQTPRMEIVSILLTSMLKDQYYRKGDETIKTLRKLIGSEKDHLFMAKAALYARNRFGMRSVTHVAAGEIARHVKGEQWTRPFFQEVIRRPDDALEIMAYYSATYGKPFPNSLKDGVAMALGEFDEYALSKYRGAGKNVSMVDTVNLVHPKPTERNGIALARLVKNELRQSETWEAQLTEAGADASKRGEVWAGLLAQKKLGYFALLRNLRNIAKDAPEALDDAIAYLTSEKAIKDPKNLVMPFRYLVAMKELQGNRKVYAALSDALEIAVSNAPKFKGDTLVVLDVSSSMNSESKFASYRISEIGAIFAATIAKVNLADLMLFDNDARYVDYNPRDSVMSLAQGIAARGNATNFHSIFRTANKRYDRIIILSDMQGWVEGDTPKKSFAEYRKRTGADPFIHSFDLAGYGTLQFPENKVSMIAGFSEVVLDILALAEEDKNALIHEIDKIEIRRPARASAARRESVEV